MTVPGRSAIGSSMVATGSPARERSRRKPPASSCARSKASIRRRTSTSAPHAVSRNAARSSGDGRSITLAKIDSISGLASSIESPRPSALRNSALFRRGTCHRPIAFFASGAASVWTQRVKQPGTGKRPVPVGGAPGDAQRCGGFVQGEAGEETQLDQLGTGRIPPSEFLQRVVDGYEFVLRGLVG